MNVSKSVIIYHLVYENLMSSFSLFVPALTNELYKGQMGRIAVIGGSLEYTGAPYYASKSSLLFGGDISFLFCASEALIPIKTYSPEIIVAPFYSEDTISSMSSYEKIRSASIFMDKYLPRIHSLILGPGLGRNEHIKDMILTIITRSKEMHTPMVIDADGIWFLSQHISTIFGYKNCILTPNINEFNMLKTSVIEVLRHVMHNSSKELENNTSAANTECITSASFIPSYDNEVHELLDILESTVNLKGKVDDGNSSSSDAHFNGLAKQVWAVSRVLGGVTVLLKGQQDVISSGEIRLDPIQKGESEMPNTLDDIRGGRGGIEEDGKAGEDIIPSVKYHVTQTHKVYSGISYVLRFEGSSPRRCGGQGDVLAGCLGTAAYWSVLLKKNNVTLPLVQFEGVTVEPALPECNTGEDAMAEIGHNVQLTGVVTGVMLASSVVKYASQLAYDYRKRATTTPDILEHIGPSLSYMAKSKDNLECRVM